MIFFTLLSLFFGLITFHSYATFCLNALVFGILAQTQVQSFKFGRKISVWLILALASALVYGFGTEPQKALIGLAISTGAYWLFHWLKWKQETSTRLILALLCFGLFVTAWIDGVQLRRQLAQPVSPPFMTDMFVYLNTVRDYKITGDYYRSFTSSLHGFNPNYGTDHLAGEIWGWKQPLIFTVWKLLPGNTTAIQWLGVVVFSLVLVGVYRIAQVFVSPRQAVIAPFLIWPYLRYPLTEMTLLQVEWWALAAFIFGFMAYARRRFRLASIAFAVSLSIRELFAIPILGLIILQLMQKRLKTAVLLSLPTTLLFLPYYYFYHLDNVFRYQTFDLFSRATLRQGAQNGWHFIQTTLAYGSWNYAIWTARPFLLLFIANTLGFALLIIIKQKQRWQILSLLASYLLFFLLSFKLGIMDVWHDYWGIYYVPLLLAATPIVFSLLDQAAPSILTQLKKKVSI